MYTIIIKKDIKYIVIRLVKDFNHYWTLNYYKNILKN